MRHDPSWLRKLKGARVAALAALTDAERAERKAAITARRERQSAAAAVRRAAREARREETVFISQRIAQGDKLEEIASRLGISPRTLLSRAQRAGLALMQRAGFRRLSAWVSDDKVLILEALAAKWSMSREKALAALIEEALAVRASAVKRQAA